MNRIHFLLMLLINLELILCSCPGNCNDNGKCTNNVCKCDADADGLSLYTGSDCSQRVCPMGFSYGVHQVNKYNDRTTDSGPIGNKRLLSPTGVLRRMKENVGYYSRLLFENVFGNRRLDEATNPTVSSYRMLNSREFEITFSGAFANLGKVGGIMGVKSKDDKIELGTCKVLGFDGKNVDTTILFIRFEFEVMNNYYTPNDYEYEVIQSFNDCSLYEVATPKCDKDKNCELIWPKVDYYLKQSKYNPNNGKQNFCCNGKKYEFTLETIENENDFNNIGNVKFTIAKPSSDLTSDDECIAVTTDCTSDDDYKKLPSLVDNTKIPTVIDNINGHIYKVKSININGKESSSTAVIGIYDCYEINSGLKVGNAIILGKDSGNNVFIFYDFIERDIIDPSEYSLIGNGNNDYSLINGIKIDSNCKSGSCNIIWKGFKSALKLTGKKDVQFACKNSYNHTIKEISYKATTTDQSNDIIFTLKTPSDDVIPSVNDYCYLLMKSDGENAVPLIDSDLSSIPYVLDSNPIVINNNKRLFKIYDKISVTKDFTTDKVIQYKCYSLDNNNYLGLADVYMYDANSYYIYYDFINGNTVPDPSDYRYEFYYKYNDLSLINPIKITEKCTATVKESEGAEGVLAKCEMKWINYKDILDKINSDIISKTEFKFTCVSNLKIETSYDFTASIDENKKEILFKIKTDADNVPSIGDICYSQANFDGAEITDLTSSDSYLRQSIEIDYNRIVYRIKTSALAKSIGTVTCKDKVSKVELGKSTILGKHSTDVYNIYYDFLNGNTLPDPDNYDCDMANVAEMDDLMLFNPVEMTSDSSSIVWKGMKKILIDMGFYGSTTPVTVTATFACINPADGKADIIKYESTRELNEKIIDAVFKKVDGKEDASGKTCLLVSKISNPSEVLDLTNLPNLNGDVVPTINNYRVYKVKNLVDLKLSKNIGELKCYNKMTNVYLGKAFVMGKNSDEYLIRYEFDNEDGVKIPQPFLYNCIKAKEYTDLSLLFQKTIKDDGKIDFTEENKVIGLTDITNLTDGNYNFGCVNPQTNKLKVYDCTLATNTFTNSDIKAGYICGILVSTTKEGIKNPMMSDLGKTYLSEPKQSSEWYSKDHSQSVELLYGNIYKVSGVYYDIGVSGGLLGCYESDDNKCDAQVLLKKGNYYYIEYGSGCTTPDKTTYTCYLKYQYNDLSMYTTSGTVATVGSKQILTLSNYGYYLQELGFFDTMTEHKQYEFYCGESTTFTSFTGTINSKIVNNYYTEYNNGNIEFTLTNSVITTAKCHLMSLINGYSLYYENSDFYKMYYSGSSYLEKPYTLVDTNVYKLYNYALKGGSQGSDLNCIKNDGKETVKAKLLNEVNGYTFIKYSNTANPSTHYRCEISLQHSDLTLYYPTNPATDGSITTITWKGIADNTIKAGNLEVGLIVKFVCGKAAKDSEMSIYTFKVTSTTTDIKFTIDDARNPTADDTCYSLLDKNGNEIDLMKSDVYKYLIQKTATSNIPTPTRIDTSTIYIVKGVKYDVNKEGGLLKCYDSSSYKCDAKILLKENNDYFIEYGSGCTTPDSTKYKCYLQYQYNDLSMYNPIRSTKCNDGTDCSFEWKNMGYYLQEFEFFKSTSLDSLNMVCFDKSKSDGQSLITLPVKIDPKPTLPFTPKTLATITFKSNTEHVAIAADLSCNLLSTFNGKELKLEDSDLKKIYLTSSSSNQWIYKELPSSSITQVTGSVYKVSGIKYDVSKEGGLLECFDNNDEYKCDAKILLKENDYYYIKYGENCKDDAKPDKIYYNCHLKYKYNDLSMYLGSGTVANNCDGINTPCTITWSDMGYYFSKVTNKKEGSFTVSCFKVNEIGVENDGNLEIVNAVSDVSLSNVVLTISSSVNIVGDYCYLVYDFKGNKISPSVNSDVGKLHLNSDRKYLSTIVDVVVVGTIYKIPQIMYNIGNAKTATLECDKNDVEIIGSDGNGNHYADYRGLKPSTSHCYIKYIHNDLSLFHPTKASTCEVGSCDITWTNIGYYTKQIITDISKDNEYNFACINSDKVYIFKGKITSIDSESESVPGNVVFTITNTIALTADDMVYMLVDNNGKDLDIENSDLYKYKLYFILTYFDRTAGQTPKSSEVVIDRIYKVNGLDYNIIEGEMGILDCVNADKITAQLLYVDSNDNSYYIKSDSDIKDYSCSLRYLNNDLSLVNPTKPLAACKAAEFDPSDNIKVKTAAKCKIEWKDIAFYVNKVGFSVDEEKRMKFACVDSVNGKVRQYSFKSIKNSNTLTIESPGDLEFNIVENSKTVPSEKDICYALVDMEGNSIDLINTDFKYYNLNSRNKAIIEYTYTSFGVTRKDDSVYTVEGSYSVNKAGGIIKCNDIKSGKYLGKGDILGLVSGYSNKYYIRYDFEVPRKSSDIDEENVKENIVYHHNPSDYKCTVETVRKDLSYYNQPKVEDHCYGKKGSSDAKCSLEWKVPTVVLEDMGFMSKNRRRRRLSDENNEIILGGNDINNNYGAYVFTYSVNGKGNLNLEIDKNSEVVPADGAKLNPIATTKGPIKVPTSENKSKPTELMKELVASSEVKNEVQKLEVSSSLLVVTSADGKTKEIKTEVSKEELKGKTVEIADGSGDVPIIVEIINSNEFELDKNDVKINKKNLVIGNPVTVNKGVDPIHTAISSISCNKVDGSCIIKTINGIEIVEEERRTRLLGIQGNIKFTPCSADSPCNHEYIECSGAGTCDRESGECKCYNGFTGSACERMDCPNKCSNHGKCLFTTELIPSGDKYAGYGGSGDNGNDPTQTVYGCKCDSGYRGADCSLKECPSDITKVSDRDCSNNGLCDYSDGSCKCFDGYYGEACQYSIGSS